MLEDFLYSIEKINGKDLRFSGFDGIELWFNIYNTIDDTLILTPTDIKKEKTDGWYVLSDRVVGYIVNLKTKDNDIEDLKALVTKIEKFFSQKTETIETIFSPKELK